MSYFLEVGENRFLLPENKYGLIKDLFFVKRMDNLNCNGSLTCLLRINKVAVAEKK